MAENQEEIPAGSVRVQGCARGGAGAQEAEPLSLQGEGKGDQTRGAGGRGGVQPENRAPVKRARRPVPESHLLRATSCVSYANKEASRRPGGAGAGLRALRRPVRAEGLVLSPATAPEDGRDTEAGDKWGLKDSEGGSPPEKRWKFQADRDYRLSLCTPVVSGTDHFRNPGERFLSPKK